MTQYSRPETPSPRRRGPGLASFLLIIVVVLAGLVAWDNLLGRGPALANRFATNLLPDIGAKRIQVEVPVAEPRTLNVTVDPESLKAVEVDYETAVLMDIYARGNPSVVQVNTFEFIKANRFGNESDPAPMLGNLGQGSGFIWDEKGHIVTNAHVVQSADIMHITFQDGTMSVGEVVATDPDSDLAVVKIDPEGYELQPVTMGRSEELQVGMRVAVIGTPFSQEQTLTSGIVSALDRTMNTMTRYRIPDSIQFDAATNPGNSGGPLFNNRGEVVGVVSQIISEQAVLQRHRLGGSIHDREPGDPGFDRVGSVRSRLLGRPRRKLQPHLLRGVGPAQERAGRVCHAGRARRPGGPGRPGRRQCPGPFRFGRIGIHLPHRCRGRPDYPRRGLQAQFVQRLDALPRTVLVAGGRGESDRATQRQQRKGHDQAWQASQHPPQLTRAGFGFRTSA